MQAHYCVPISAPAKAKSHRWMLQSSGEVVPELTPQPVRCSSQFGPPSAVLVYIYQSA